MKHLFAFLGMWMPLITSLIFMYCKIQGYIDWTWFWVWSPVWILWGIPLITFFLVILSILFFVSGAICLGLFLECIGK